MSVFFFSSFFARPNFYTNLTYPTFTKYNYINHISFPLVIAGGHVSTMERRQSQVGGTASSYMDKATRSSISGTSSVTNKPSQIKKRDVRRVEKTDQRTRVLDPEGRDIDRTPHSLIKTAPQTKTVKRTKGKDESGWGVSASVAEGSQSRLESSDSGSESSKVESDNESDDEDSLTGMERLALDDTADTSSMDSRLPEDKRKKKEKSQGASEDTSEEGLLSKLGGRETPTKDRPRRKDREDVASATSKKKEMTWQEKKEWREAPGTVTLSETPTFFLLEKPDEQICISGDALEEDTSELRKKFDRYFNFCANSKGNDRYANSLIEFLITNLNINKTKSFKIRYAERGMLTLNEPSKNKESQKALPAVASASMNFYLKKKNFLLINHLII